MFGGLIAPYGVDEINYVWYKYGIFTYGTWDFANMMTYVGRRHL